MKTAQQPSNAASNSRLLADNRNRNDSHPSSATIVPITSHPDHPIHSDMALVKGVLNGDPISIRRFQYRIRPYVDTFASDPFWCDYGTAFQRGMDVIAADQFYSMRRWNPERRSLGQHIDHLLRRNLRDEMAQRRIGIRESFLLTEAIKASVDSLSDTHYWILSKILIEGIRPKRLLSLVNECPDIRLRSMGSIGSTYSRALRRLREVCPQEYQETVDEFLHTRQKSGRYS
jgi:hypothetical protein